MRPRLRVEWRGGSLYLIAQRERLAAVLAEIARRTGIKVEGAEQLQEMVSSVEVTKAPLEEALERLLARDDYAIQKEAAPNGSTRLRVVILRGAPDASGLVAGGAVPAAPGPAAAPPRAAVPIPDIPSDEEEDPGKRLQKLQVLVRSNQDEARVVLPALAKALGDDDDSVRDFAIQTLVSRGSPEAMGYLRHVLEDPDPTARLALVESIGEKQEGRGILQEALNDSDESVRSEAAALLKEDEPK